VKRRRGHALQRRYGLPAPGTFKSNFDIDPRHAYRAVLLTIYNNPGSTRAELRMWEAQRGLHKAVTNKVLSTAEERGHVRISAGRYSLTDRGIDVANARWRST